MDNEKTQNRTWYSLKEAAALKGINYNTLLNRRHLQPGNGEEDARIGGRKKWRWDTIRRWLEMTDYDLEEQFFESLTEERYDLRNGT